MAAAVVVRRAAGVVRADALGFEGLMAMIAGDLPLATTRLADSESLYRELDARGGLALTQMLLGRLAGIQGDLAGFEAGARGALALFEELGSAWGIGGALPDIAEVQIARGDPRGAIETCLAAMEVLEGVDAQWHAAAALVVIVQALQVDGQLESGARVCGILTEWHQRLGAPVFPVVAASYERHRALIEEALGQARFTELHDEGRLLPRTPPAVASLLGVERGGAAPGR